MDLFASPGRVDMAFMNTNLSPAPEAFHEDPSVAFEGTIFQLLVENVTDAIFLLDLETELCAYVSPSVQGLLGRDPTELTGRTLTEFVHPDDAHEVLARSVRRREGGGVRTAVTRMLHADGRWIWVQSNASPVVTWDERTMTVFSVSEAAERVRAELGLRSARARLRGILTRLADGGDLQQTRDGTYDLTVEALAAALELRDDESCRHARRVTDLALRLTAIVDADLARDPELRYAYLLHDIGKIGIPDSILLKPGELTKRELQTLQMHTTLGEHLISYVPFLTDIVHDVVAFHHEWWDGTGYPWGLAGESIPVAARIFAVADAFDAMTSNRPYRRALSVPVAIEELERCAGSQFDPSVVAAFVPLAQKLARRGPRALRSAS